MAERRARRVDEANPVPADVWEDRYGSGEDEDWDDEMEFTEGGDDAYADLPASEHELEGDDLLDDDGDVEIDTEYFAEADAGPEAVEGDA